ncbi:MAG TPA: hypothetical protein DD727_05885 [Clostridiales bacterium]|nr:hypothetical protein [Clostridiales bacterium]
MKWEITQPYQTEMRDYYMSLGMDHLEMQDDKQVSVWYYDDYSVKLEKAGFLDAYREATWDREKGKVFPFPGPAQWHPDAWTGRKAAEYIEALDGDAPLFTWVSFSGPHYPFDAPAEYYARVDMEKLDPRIICEGEYDDAARIHHRSYHGADGIDGAHAAPGRACKNFTEGYWTELRRNYLANVALIDDAVGHILDAAKRKFGSNLLVIFTADHGEMLGNHGLWGKHNCGYEDVWNIPMIVKYPDAEEGAVSQAMVMLTDILPACVKAAGGTVPPCDGMDFRENMAAGGHRYVIGEGEGYLSISDGTSKYIHIQKKNENFREFIDMAADPLETVNGIRDPANAGKLSELRERALEILMKDLLP